MGIISEFVLSPQAIIYAKQKGAQMATFAATGTRADIDDLRKKMVALGMRLIDSWVEETFIRTPAAYVHD